MKWSMDYLGCNERSFWGAGSGLERYHYPGSWQSQRLDRKRRRKVNISWDKGRNRYLTGHSKHCQGRFFLFPKMQSHWKNVAICVTVAYNMVISTREKEVSTWQNCIFAMGQWAAQSLSSKSTGSVLKLGGCNWRKNMISCENKSEVVLSIK